MILGAPPPYRGQDLKDRAMTQVLGERFFFLIK